MTAPTVPVELVEPGATNEARRLEHVFTAPTQVFDDVRRRATWLAPWLVLAICYTLSAVVLVQKVDTVAFVRQQLDASGRGGLLSRLPADQEQAQLRRLAVVAEIRLYAAPVLTLIVALGVSALLMALFNGMFQASIGFNRAFAVMSYSLLPLALGALLVVPFLLLHPDPRHVDLRDPIVLGPAILLSPEGGRFLYELAKSFNVFQLWVLFLLGLGFHRVAKPGTLSQAQASAIALGLYVVWALARAALIASFA